MGTTNINWDTIEAGPELDRLIARGMKWKWTRGEDDASGDYWLRPDSSRVFVRAWHPSTHPTQWVEVLRWLSKNTEKSLDMKFVIYCLDDEMIQVVEARKMFTDIHEDMVEPATFALAVCRAAGKVMYGND